MGETGLKLFGASLFAGILFYHGIDPEGIIVEALVDVLFEVVTPEFRWVARIIAILIAAMGILANFESVMSVIDNGGLILVAAVFGFIGGYMVNFSEMGGYVIIVGMFAGAFAPD